MQKALCIIALAISIIVFALFLADLVLGFLGMPDFAPFKYANVTMDIVFSICSAILGALSWFTFKEQV